uniref:DENN domain-containing protein 11 n=1 Tax=Strigamia maritima TaxID=126957 RepID=T1IHJ7_STRMM
MLSTHRYAICKMSSKDDRTPLLLDVDDTQGDYCTNENAQAKKVSGRTPESTCLSSLSEPIDRYIICVFVVAFDTRAGNLVEWCMPDDCDLDGIEFKAMASGCHKVQSDFIYFKKGSSYGASCFENMPVDSEIERGARMKSVGVLAASYLSLYTHIPFLEEQVSYLLENPGKYEHLKDFYERWKAVLPSAESKSFITPSISRPMTSQLTAMHPAGCFSQFIKFFGDQTFLLWKYMLLKKRILFYSPPPIGVVCYRVNCARCLTLHNAPEIVDQIVQPLFYISVGDVDFLESETSFIACTTDKILESKLYLYDVYVDNQNVRCSDHALQKSITITPADKQKLNKLSCSLKDSRVNLLEKEDNEELIFSDFFRDLNTRIFRTLLDISYSNNKEITSTLVRSMGLDPVGDRNFLIQLLETYGIDAVIMVESPCCS